MLSKLFWKISAAMFIGFGILLTGCAKDDPSSEEVNAVIAERLDLTEEQAARVQPVTAEIWAERETLRTLRINLYDQILVQLKNESVDQEELQNMLYSSWNQMEPMIPKAVNAFSEYHAVLSEEKRNELSEKLEKRRSGPLYFLPERKNQRNRMDAGNHPGGCNFVPDFPDISGAEMGASTGPLAFRRSRGPCSGAA